MTTKTMLFLALAALAPAVHAQTADIRATRCNACGDMQFEQAAIGQGVGKRWLYDFANGELRAYQVGREPNGGGGFFYEAVQLPVEAVYQTLFDRALDVYRRNGSLAKSVTLTLVGAPGTEGHADDSVFDLFNSRSGMATFSLWLARYMQQQGIPVSPDASEIQALVVANPKIEFTGDKTRVRVLVVFKDGQAEFDLSATEKSYGYVSGTALDANNGRIPESASQLTTYNHLFPGGVQSSSYLGFLSLMQYWRVPIGTGGWLCTEVEGGGSVARNCYLDR
ncbi:MAG TPA: hypothetical protein VJ724_04840 [Tahibacter sp.]|nr:hypothetical protein [Tahibacter sp.]